MALLIANIKEDVPTSTTAYTSDASLLRALNRGKRYIEKIEDSTIADITGATTDAQVTVTQYDALVYYIQYDICLNGGGTGLQSGEKISYKIDSLAVTKEASSGTSTETGVEICEDWLKLISNLFADEQPVGFAQAYNVIS